MYSTSENQFKLPVLLAAIKLGSKVNTLLHYRTGYLQVAAQLSTVDYDMDPARR
jgi:hypothetical protein